MLEKVQYMTEKGQITLSVAWRRTVGVRAVVVKLCKGDRLEITPVHTKEDNETGWISVFDAKRDNYGKGVSIKDFRVALKK